MLWLALACTPDPGAPPGSDPEDTGTDPGTDPSTTDTGTTDPGDGSVTDRFVQDLATTVDVLFVVDDSGSMGDHQHRFDYLFPWFLDRLDGVDWHVGVVSTDVEDPERSGRLQRVDGHKWIDTETPEPDAIFSGMFTVGTSGSSDSQGLAATQLALEGEADGYNAGFLRDGSDLHVIVVSDGPDHTPGITRGEFVEWFTDLREAVSFSSVVELAGPERGDDYIAVSETVGGVIHDLADDPDGTFEALATLAAGLDREFALSVRPDPDTLEVSVHDPIGLVLEFEAGDDYALDPTRNTVVFSTYVPDVGAEVLIRYFPAAR